MDNNVSISVTEKLSIERIQRCIQSLIHACRCKDANCTLQGCQIMKRIVTHTKVCRRKTNGYCRIYKQLVTLCCYHTKHCQGANCLVPFCSNLKLKMKHQKLQARLQQAQLLRRRMAVMNTRPTGQVGAIQSAQQSSNANMSAGVAMKPGMSPTNLPSPHQSGIGLKLGTETPPAHVLQVIKQVQEEAARQQAPHVGYGKVTPGGGVGVGVGVGGQGGSVMPPPQMQRPMLVPMPNTGSGHLIPMDQWTPRDQPNTVMQQNPGLRQQSPQQLMQQQQQLQGQPGMGIGGQMPRQPEVMGGPVEPVSQVGPGCTSSLHNRAYQQLMATLKSPNSPEQQNQILHILKSNPSLMAAFIKWRQQMAQQLMQQQQQLQGQPGMGIDGQMPRQPGDMGGPVAPVSQAARELSIQTCLRSLIHALQCRDAKCQLSSCPKMKRVVTHNMVCKRKTNGFCPICKQLVALCCYHAKRCQEAKCLVPFCSNLKLKMKHQKLQARLRQAELYRRRMAAMNNPRIAKAG